MDYTGKTLSWTVREGALEVELHRAPCNEIGTTTLAELEFLARVVRNGAYGCHALILHSSRDEGFCAGADLRELHAGLRQRRGGLAERLGALPGPAKKALQRAASPLIRREIRRFLDRIHAVFDTLDTAPMLTIAAVHRVCFGGGFELALTSDLIVADKTARFCFPELRLGLVPGFGGIPRLERDVGNAVVRDLLLTGRSLNARRAHEIGLASQLVGQGQALTAARSIAKQAGKFDAAVVRTAKRFAKPLPKARLEEEKRTFVRLITSPTVQKALDDFVSDDSAMPYLPKAAAK